LCAEGVEEEGGREREIYLIPRRLKGDGLKIVI